MNLSSRLLSGVVTFVTVVDAGSFRGAARLLGVTPSGVSRGVSRLEEQLGVRLFNRHPRAIALTDEGSASTMRSAPWLTELPTRQRPRTQHRGT
jgi:DNA-binding transcriptional LysR family regulator